MLFTSRSLIVLLPFGLLAACDKPKPPAPQPRAEATAAPAAPAVPAGKVDRSHAGEPAPAMPFTGPGGGPATLTSFRGRPLVVNLWATWCAPCLKEMPALDTLAASEGSAVKLITVSQDMAGKRAVEPFFRSRRFKALTQHLDKENVLMLALKADTLPLTIKYDARGREVWRVAGAFDWASPEARTLVEG